MTKIKFKKSPPTKKSNVRVSEEIGLAMAFVLVIIGIGMTNFMPRLSYRYWITLTLIFAVLSSVIGGMSVYRHPHNDHGVIYYLATQFAHWLFTFLAIMSVYLLLKTGRLNFENTGLVMGIILGLSTFLDGFHRVGWRFALLGAAILLATLGAAYMEAFIWPIVFLILGLWLLTFLWFLHYKKKKKG